MPWEGEPRPQEACLGRDFGECPFLKGPLGVLQGSWPDECPSPHFRLPPPSLSRCLGRVCVFIILVICCCVMNYLKTQWLESAKKIK